jgi:anthranilate/para-aminobenzoate synthase component II
MPVLIVDNYDSFTYNLVEAVATISASAPSVIRNDEMGWRERLGRLYILRYTSTI